MAGKSIADAVCCVSEAQRKNECTGGYHCDFQGVLNAREPVPLLRWVAETVPIILWAVDAEGIFLLSEGKALAGLGLKPGEVVGLSIFDIYAEYPAVVCAIRRMFAGEEFIETVEIDGHHYEVHFIPVRSVNNRVCGGVGISLEITRRRHAERKIIEQEHLFETIFVALPQAFVLATPERIIHRVNPAAEHLFGYSGGELCGMSTRVLYADETQYEEVGRNTVLCNGALTLDMKCLRKDGSMFVSEAVCTKLLGGAGKVQWLVGMHRDVTEERKAGALLHWHEETLRAMIDAAPTMALLLNCEGTVLIANRRFADHFGLSSEQLVKCNIADIYDDPEIVLSRRKHIQKALDSGIAAAFTDSCNGRWFEHHVSPLPDADGGYSRVAITILDITERVKREDEAREQIAIELHEVVSEMLETGSEELFVRDNLYGKSLTPRELEVLKEIASGLSTKMIAHKFGVSTKTVESQRLAIMRKLRLFNVAELTKYALREGLTTLESRGR